VKNQLNIARRDLFKKMGAVAGAVGLAGLLPGSASAETEAATGTSASATVRVILANATSVQWMAVTSAGLTVGGQTTLVPGGKLNADIIKGAVAAIIAGGGPRLTSSQVILLGGQS
jgi:hypothetical protein